MQITTRAAVIVGLVTVCSALGCRDLSNPTLPDGVRSPETYHSREGGVMLAEEALRQFRSVWREMTINTGLLTDELSAAGTTERAELDRRVLPEQTAVPSTAYPQQYEYAALHKLRGQARLARGVLAEYAPDMSSAVRGRLYAFEGYAEIWLADLFCSGIPLSTIDFKKDFTYQAPSTTEEVYLHAVTLFDSALALSADSVAVRILAQVGKGRALLAVGQYAKAEAAVADVQPNDAYRLRVAFRTNFGGSPNLFAQHATVSDREGINGLVFRTSGDPRTASPLMQLPVQGQQSIREVFFPNKYVPPDSNWVAIASGIEAQLIRAEAALHRNESGNWLSLLNRLRTTGAYTRIDTVYTDTTRTAISRVDTLWEAGEGGVAGLKPLEAAATEQERIDTHFAERAAWLFVSAQRQGDLRRLVRVYGRTASDLYPQGTYAGNGGGLYGEAITVPIPPAERRNPMFRGCLNRD